eukprot:TRINITY_DN19031_c0_g1_i1.p1 TRINITY_DN19031_c0_g1~~TRINITY_DN19031_c0_g1_i1.p1  ORF type:complete len:292 (+),score=86.92 TRINITY_DN19031_c0_g1_i1:76-951(+)
MAQPRCRRSVLITVDASVSASSFARQLSELRRQHPEWTVQGVAAAAAASDTSAAAESLQPLHEGRALFPRRPPPSLVRSRVDAREAGAEDDADRRVSAYVAELAEWELRVGRLHSAEGGARGQPEDPSEARSSSGGVSVDAGPPRRVRRGMRVRLTQPPLRGRIGEVLHVKDDDSFQVDLGGGNTWWCTREEVEYAPPRREGEAASAADGSAAQRSASGGPAAGVCEDVDTVSQSTLRLCEALRLKVAAQEATLLALRQALRADPAAERAVRAAAAAIGAECAALVSEALR